jgi:hypothetical protein
LSQAIAADERADGESLIVGRNPGRAEQRRTVENIPVVLPNDGAIGTGDRVRFEPIDLCQEIIAAGFVMITEIVPQVDESPPCDVGRLVHSAGQAIAYSRHTVRVHAHDAPRKFVAVSVVVQRVFRTGSEIDLKRIVEAEFEDLTA